MADWEKEKAAAIVNRWVVLEPKTMSATNRSTLDQGAGRLDLVSGPNKNGVVTIVAETELTGITGLRLEVLTDSRLPNKGPGRATDGNFVLNELELTAAPKADPKQAKPVKLEKALADFSQASSRGRQGDRRQRRTTRQRLGRLAGHRGRSTGRRSRPPSRSAAPAARC